PWGTAPWCMSSPAGRAAAGTGRTSSVTRGWPASATPSLPTARSTGWACTAIERPGRGTPNQGTPHPRTEDRARKKAASLSRDAAFRVSLAPVTRGMRENLLLRLHLEALAEGGVAEEQVHLVLGVVGL